MVAMRKAGIIPFLVDLIKLKNRDILVPVAGILEECAIEKNYKTAIKTEGMMEYIVKNLNSNDLELQRICSSVIQKCAEDEDSRELVRVYGGLEPLVSIASSAQTKDLLAAATGAIWKCSMSPENVARFQDLKSIDLLVSLLNNQPEKDPGEMVRSFVGGLELIVSLLKSDNLDLLTAVCACIAEIAQDKESLAVLTDHGVVSLLSQLSSTEDLFLRRRLAEAIACCCGWNNNRAVFGEQGAVKPLVGYLKTKSSACNNFATSCNASRSFAAIPTPLSSGSKAGSANLSNQHTNGSTARCSDEHDVIFNIRRSTVKALFELSKYPENCVAMHKAGVVKLLVNLVGSQDPMTQEAAASCLLNIRRLAIESM